MSAISKGKGNPRIGTILRTKFENTPTSPTNRHQKRKAVVIDCEMVTVSSGRRHIASIGAVDFLTGEVLLNHHVYPEMRIVNYNTRYSGINHASMMAAVNSGVALRGWEGARQALWEHVDKDTVLIGHALQNDLATIGVIHSRVVDSQILTGEAIFPTLPVVDSLPRLTGLKGLTSELVGYEIQTGRKGHTALEDAYATRDVIIWCLRNPGLLDDWAVREKKQYEEYKKQQKEKREQKKKKDAAKGSAAAVATDPVKPLQTNNSDECGRERGSDIAEGSGPSP
ncbi:hypothetical protein BO94DRAFT_358106 [Aspergillus sclerotioniger CBS 115572]|uniref:Exonuclease domain-containing protein n=1 Tax=Aspergillus sclerotioniger CBS 115572 TaxID=1450535 RepID=A0A317X2Y5_9EURO|nr:hypothetical protein BO94DRAFT_358106 [Aspergillus sclerotioniger CBS 115572]PWY92994.1 hypothetical protein BO94DRAFT_358106 [Aspergillus sclerotioniger CBS 115572]